MYLKRSFFIYVINLIFLWGTTDATAFAHTIDLPSNLVAPGGEIKTLKSGINFGEGPAVDSEGNLYFSDIQDKAGWG